MIHFNSDKFNKHRSNLFRAKLFFQIIFSILIIWGGQFFEVDIIFSSGIALFWICLLVWEFAFSVEGRNMPSLRLLASGDPILGHLSEQFQKKVKILIGPKPERKRWEISGAGAKFVLLEDKFIEDLTPIQSAKFAALTYHTRLTDQPTIGMSLLSSQISLTCMAFLLFSFTRTKSFLAGVYIGVLAATSVIFFCYTFFSNAGSEAKSDEDVQAFRDVLAKLEELRPRMPALFPLTRWSKFRLFLSRLYVNQTAAKVAKMASQ